MDGNRRWAKKKNLKSIEGHKAGVSNAINLLSSINNLDNFSVENITLYVFSKDNWKRPTIEISGLFNLIESFYLRFENTGRKMEIDIWVPELSLGFEYQGEQHYAVGWRGILDISDFKNQQYRDSQKRTSCIEMGIQLIEIPYTWDRTEGYVIRKILEKGIRLE